MQTDPIADFLTAIRNANTARHNELTFPTSKVKVEIARILKEEGYINDYEVTPDEQKKQGRIRIVMRYADGRERVIQHIERVSKPGRRIYVGKNDIQRVLGGLGVAILSTPRGVLTDRAAKRAGVGGELLAKVY
ncbi:MAG TPA: 30S ribosomal protein S8 [Abditibacteriaceae bacterium]|jgi:small subunit ribosomal protein S8